MDAFDPYAKIKNEKVREYLRKKDEEKKNLKNAEDMQDLGGYADVASNVLSGFANANKPKDVILYNSFGNMGSAPKVSSVDDVKVDLSPIKNTLNLNAKRAQDRYNQVDKDFDTDIKAGQTDRDLQYQDPTSAVSKSAQTLARSAIAAKMKEATIAGDADGVEQLRSIDVNNMSAADAKSLYDQLKNTDYKDVINNNAQDKRHNATLAAEERRITRAEQVAEKKDKDAKYSRAVELRKELNKNDAFKNAQETDLRLAQVDELAKNPNGVSDEALLVMYQKTLDPGSVVREGEFARTAQGQAILGQIDSWVQAKKTGQRLTPELKANVINAMKALRDGNRAYLNKAMVNYEYEIRNHGLDRNIIMAPDTVASTPTETPAAASKPSKVMKAGDLP